MDATSPAPLNYSLHDDTLPADAAATVDQGLGAANLAAAPLHEVRALACFVRDGSGTVVGGAVGRTWGACAEILQLWVAPAHRGAGVGSELVRRFEARAAGRGCELAYLETFSFQAPAFYRALGYAQAHAITQFPHGFSKLLMQRRLAATPPVAAPAAATGGTAMAVRRIDAVGPGLALALAALLEDVVLGGASVGFVLPLSAGQAQAWAAEVLSGLGPALALWVAERDGRIVGTVQLAPCLKPNGRHRGEVMKLLVQRQARGLGVASALMAALESHARASGLTLLVLDTEVGSPAEAIYRHLGWQHHGDVPGYALTPQGRLHATACMHKALG